MRMSARVAARSTVLSWNLRRGVRQRLEDDLSAVIDSHGRPAGELDLDPLVAIGAQQRPRETTGR